MTPKVRLFNDNIHPLSELFKGETVTIDSKDYWRDKKGNIKELDLFEANDFRGQYHPVPFDGSGKMINDSRHYKMIKMEPVEMEIGEVTNVESFKCMMKDCKFVGTTSEQLDNHAKDLHPNVERLSLPEQDHEIKKNKKVG